MATMIVDAKQVARSLTVNLRLTGMKTWRARLWLAAKVFALGAWIAGTQFEISID